MDRMLCPVNLFSTRKCAPENPAHSGRLFAVPNGPGTMAHEPTQEFRIAHRTGESFLLIAQWLAPLAWVRVRRCFVPVRDPSGPSSADPGISEGQLERGVKHSPHRDT